MVMMNRSATVAQSHWGCTSSPDIRKPKHLVDQERSARAGEAVALCGEFLVYLDGDQQVRSGLLCSGRQMLSERQNECRRCTRRQAERQVETVTIPVAALVTLAASSPGVWGRVATSIDAYAVASVNALL